MSWLSDEVRLLDCEICKELSVSSHVEHIVPRHFLFVISCLDAASRRRLIVDHTISLEEHALAQKEVQVLEDGVLKQVPANHVQEMKFHIYDLLVRIRIISVLVQ
jgi:hypothetical protein